MKSTYFDSQVSRLKQALSAREDQEVASALEMTKAAFSARKKRGSFPEKELYTLAAKRPELGLDVDYVLTGITAAARGLGDAARSRSQRASDTGLDFQQLHKLSAAQGPGPTPPRLAQIAAMLPTLRATEFDGVFAVVKAIVELRAALEQATKPIAGESVE